MTSRLASAGTGLVTLAVACGCLGCSSAPTAAPGSSAPTTASASAPPAAPTSVTTTDRPVLDGLYLQFVDGPASTYNGVPRPAGSPMTQWWAFRSACMPTGCVATSTKLNDFDTNVAEMPPNQRVYRFVNGAWEWAHDDSLECETVAGGPAPGSTQARFVTRLTPQPDGRLAGGSTSTALDDGCGDKGAVVTTPTVYTRKGEVPPDVPMIDPTTA
jgi:serine/threonine-protein kinase